MTKKGFFANRKSAATIGNNTPTASDNRFDLAEFEREVIAEARANNQIAHITKDLIDPDPNQPAPILIRLQWMSCV